MALSNNVSGTGKHTCSVKSQKREKSRTVPITDDTEFVIEGAAMDECDDWRKGKWTVEEEQFAEKLTEVFKSGQVILTEEDGRSLRSFLAKRLHCNPMRISKKFAKIYGLGTRFQPVEISQERVDAYMEELDHFEKIFREKDVEVQARLKMTTSKKTEPRKRGSCTSNASSEGDNDDASNSQDETDDETDNFDSLLSNEYYSDFNASRQSSSEETLISYDFDEFLFDFPQQRNNTESDSNATSEEDTSSTSSHRSLDHLWAYLEEIEDKDTGVKSAPHSSRKRQREEDNIDG
eukprot:gene2471-4795_t